MDTMVLAAQQWVNAQYTGRSGYETCRTDSVYDDASKRE